MSFFNKEKEGNAENINPVKMEGCLITAKNLSKTFNRRNVLDDLNLEISRGENAVFIGRNGSGKTTFIR